MDMSSMFPIEGITLIVLHPSDGGEVSISKFTIPSLQILGQGIIQSVLDQLDDDDDVNLREFIWHIAQIGTSREMNSLNGALEELKKYGVFDDPTFLNTEGNHKVLEFKVMTENSNSVTEWSTEHDMAITAFNRSAQEMKNLYNFIVESQEAVPHTDPPEIKIRKIVDVLKRVGFKPPKKIETDDRVYEI